MLLKKGVKLLDEKVGEGEVVLRQHNYLVAIRLCLNKGEFIKIPQQCLSHSVDDNMKVRDDGFFEHRTRIDREQLIAGMFYAIQDMRIGGYRKVSISPHLAYGEQGIPGVIPPDAIIIAEIHVLREIEDL